MQKPIFATGFSVFLSAALMFAQTAPHSASARPPIPPHVEAALSAITPANLRGDLSFLASDALQGRFTPSPGLEVAAEFIASQFRAEGLEPGGNEGYFQTALMVDRHIPAPASNMTIVDGPETFAIPPAAIAITSTNEAATIDHAPVVVFPKRDPELLKGVDLAHKAIVVPQFPRAHMSQAEMMDAYEKLRAFDAAVSGSQAAIEVVVGSRRRPQNMGQLLPADEAATHSVPSVLVANDELQKWIEQPKASETRTISFDVPAPEDKKITVKNVIGILRGSDPALKDTCVLLTAHYDHIGTTETATGMAMNRTKNPDDHIYNGANDDGSGTVSVIEIARALARLNPHPKRSIVFMTFFGEERGELGSQYYAKHPVFPLAKTVADVNLEQVGRTDSTEGPEVNSASLTGFDYSDVTKYFEQAGRETGIRVYLDKEASDAYFVRSDNAALAVQGVPAHSLTVAFDYPDYHGLGDEWQKIDYDNMARVDRMIALGLVDIANSPKAPKWNAANPKTAPFRQARARLGGE